MGMHSKKLKPGDHGTNIPQVEFFSECIYNGNGTYSLQITFRLNIIIYINPDSPKPRAEIIEHELRHKKIWDNWYPIWSDRFRNIESNSSAFESLGACLCAKKKLDKQAKDAIYDNHLFSVKEVDGYWDYIKKKAGLK